MKRPIPALGQEMYRMNLECLVTAEGKEVRICYFDRVERTQEATGRGSPWLKMGLEHQ